MLHRVQMLRVIVPGIVMPQIYVSQQPECESAPELNRRQ